MLSGFGNQEILKESYTKDRAKRLEDRRPYSDEDRVRYEASTIDLGGGKTDPKSFEIEQYPHPQDTAVRSRQTLDIRYFDPRIGE